MIFDIDYQGARQIRAKVHDAIGVFILPPSMEELERRLRGRASDSEEVIRRRFQAAKREIEHYALFDYVIVNDDLKRAFEQLAAVVLAERSKRARRAHLAEALLRVPPRAESEGKRASPKRPESPASRTPPRANLALASLRRRRRPEEKHHGERAVPRRSR